MGKSKEAAKKAIRQDRVIAGSPHDFMEVRHLVLQGTNEEIGRSLATIARERYGVGPVAGSDPLLTRAQRRYFERHCPIHADRMNLIAALGGGREGVLPGGGFVLICDMGSLLLGALA